jgi:glutamate-5-semialdehyde dehydrogenase
MNLSFEIRNNVLLKMAFLIKNNANTLLEKNKIDLNSFKKENDIAMYDRLKIDALKIESMIDSLEELAKQNDPLNVERYTFTHDNGLKISNKTTAFGTVLIIYESRPDVTIEAAGIAFKSGNKIILKGGKEAVNSNLYLVNLWHKALENYGVDRSWITYLNLNRNQTQDFLKHPTQKLDLIIPRGGEKLIQFVKQYATAPVIVSGRGNNFLYIHKECDINQAIDIIINAKTTKISACNALDKVLIDINLPELDSFISTLISNLLEHKVEILGDETIQKAHKLVKPIPTPNTWYEEFLDFKIVIAVTPNETEAIQTINTYSGGHSASICTTNQEVANLFMTTVDCAAVYHNASTRFTDGFEFGLGGELAISTDKLHQRGPIGLKHLVTNKWYVIGHGQTR